ncbi:hypothetical protein MSPP1_003256 [Malassezia sp. CBS 17886]|nr:hypothetical protein MSPP1_003256 [Malassezia sp. CBS 17886]
MGEPATASELPTLKVLLIGSSGVGKTALLARYTDDVFLGPEETTPTIGVDYRVKTICVGEKWFKLNLWDTAGQERYRALTSSYYRGAQGVILGVLPARTLTPVYDVTSEPSFDALPSWIEELKIFTGTTAPVVLLVGNKVDRDAERTVDANAARRLAQAHDYLHVECSAKQGRGVDHAFDELVHRIVSTPALWSSVDPGVRRPGDRIPGGAPSGAANSVITLGGASAYVGGRLAAAQEQCRC